MKFEHKKFDFRKFFYQYVIKFLVSLLVATGIFLSIYGFNGFTLMSALDGCFYATMCMLIATFGSIATNAGFFDIFAYNGIRIVRRLRREDKDGGSQFYGTYDYTKSKEEKRRENKRVYLSYLLVALIYFVPTITLYGIYRVNLTSIQPETTNLLQCLLILIKLI